MKSIGLSMTSVEVKADTRVLRATWSRDLSHDLKSYHGINIDDLASQLMSEMIKSKRKQKIYKIFKQ